MLQSDEELELEQQLMLAVALVLQSGEELELGQQLVLAVAGCVQCRGQAWG